MNALGIARLVIFAVAVAVASSPISLLAAGTANGAAL
ncbi:hypothetical protein BH18CHL1_BH18CHL1_02090 [soil metagenome]